MSESESRGVPIEYTKERPPVFPSSESFELVKGFALRSHELHVKPDAKKRFDTTLDLIRHIEGAVGSRVRETLPEVFDAKNVPEDDRDILLDAAQNRNFANIDFTDKEKVIGALGLAMVAERARTRMMRETLETMDGEGLTPFGMTSDQRDIVVGLLRALEVGNLEYMRFKARAMSGEEYGETAPDAVREEHRIAEGVGRVRKQLLEKGPEKVFGEAGSEFADYLALYERGYRPLSKEEGTPLTVRGKKAKATLFRDAFEQFLAEHPDFPLILFPRGDEYVSDASGMKLGRDPEIRVSWQSPELKEESHELLEIRERFIEHLRRTYGDLLESEDADRIGANRPLIADDLGYFGIGSQVRFEAQELEGTSVLFRNVQLENRAGITKAMRMLFGEEAAELGQSPEFLKISDIEIMTHEWGHQVHNPDTKGAKKLGEAEEGINEMKSDALSFAALTDAYGERARALFGERGQETLNKYLLGYMADWVTRQAPDSEDRPYYISAVALLNRFAEAGVIRQDEQGNITADQSKLNGDWSKEIFQPHARHILELYHNAAAAKSKELARIREEATALGNEAPRPEVEALMEQVRAAQKQEE